MSIILPYSTKAATSAGRVASVFNLLLLQSLWKARWFSAASCQHPLFGRSTAAGAYTDEFVHFNGQAVGYIDNTGGQTYHIVNDHLGSARVMTSTTGVTKFDADYYPQGTPHVVTGTKDVVLKFQGKQLDTESGLANARRMYSPTLARFLPTRVAAVPSKFAKKKPVPAPQSLNPGSLAASNPVTQPNSLISSFIDLFAPGGIGSQSPAPCVFYFSVGDEMEHGVCGFEGPPDPLGFGDFPLPFTISLTTCSCNNIGSIVNFPSCIYRCKGVDGDNAPSVMNVFVLDAECKRAGTPIRFGTCPRRVETARIRINIFDAGASVHFDKPTLCSSVD